jgi:arylsulfatase
MPFLSVYSAKILRILREKLINHRYINQWLLFSGIPFILFGTSACNESNKQDSRPNILLIVADDLGYGDIGCYGGDIQTPNIDALARQGVRFSSFHTAPMCAPTRAMLLSGNDNHIAGMGAQSRETDEFGYEGQLTDRIVPVPTLLREAGYHTYMAGKWHLGSTPNANPHRKGFERSFVLLPGAGNHYNSRSVLGPGYSAYTEDGDSVSWEEGRYSTDFYTDKIIEYIDQNASDSKPFFAYAAYTSPHWPLQVDRKFWKKYVGMYDDGYETLRKKRLESLKKAGMIPKHTSLPDLHPRVKPWDSLSEQEKMQESRKMELYAGMVDNLDFNIGRLLAFLNEIGQLENTMVVFMSDNGAAHRDFYYRENMNIDRTYFTAEYNRMGDPNSYVSYGPQWAEAGSAPFRYFKDYATQGGVNTTLIVSGPGVSRENEIFHGLTTVQDLAPTFYALAEETYPETYRDKPAYPLRGASLLPYLTGQQGTVHDSDYIFALEHHGHAMVRQGNWKITNTVHPFDISNFGLYDIASDPGEQRDLKDEKPELYAALLAAWEKYAKEVGVRFPTPKGE